MSSSRVPWRVEPVDGCELPPSWDLTPWFPPVVDQGRIPLCTAAVAAGICGYYACRNGEDFTASVLFNYRTSRLLIGERNRAGSTLRWSFEAWNEYGMVEEEEWPLAMARENEDPPPSCFTRATARRGITYDRVMGGGGQSGDHLRMLKSYVLNGIPVAIDIPLHPVQLLSFSSQVLLLPPEGARAFGRHVLVIAGYDDSRVCDGRKASGAFLVRNSWGSKWAARGYGWLPYSYIENRMVREAWVVSELRWMERPLEA